jgi:hypothetical protein
MGAGTWLAEPGTNKDITGVEKAGVRVVDVPGGVQRREGRGELRRLQLSGTSLASGACPRAKGGERRKGTVHCRGSKSSNKPDGVAQPALFPRNQGLPRAGSPAATCLPPQPAGERCGGRPPVTQPGAASVSSRCHCARRGSGPGEGSPAAAARGLRAPGRRTCARGTHR